MAALAKLIYVEADEEITELVDRLRTLQSEVGVTLVIPDGPRALLSPMSFRLLKRYAQSYGIELSVVSADPKIQSLSLETGFTTFGSVEAREQGLEIHRPGSLESPEVAQALAASRPPPRPPVRDQASSGPPKPAIPAVASRPIVSAPPSRPAPSPAGFLQDRSRQAGPQLPRPVFAAAGLVVLLAILVAGLYFPTATVTLSVAGTKLEANTQLVGAPNLPAGAADRFQTKALEATASQSAQGTATGQKQVPATFAFGEVVFSVKDCSSESDCSSGRPGVITPIRMGVAVSTADGKVYTTQKPADLRGPTDAVRVQVGALNRTGSLGNTGAGTIRFIGSQHPREITVDNPTAITTGTDARSTTVIQDSDINVAKQALVDQLAPRVQNDLNAKAAGLHLVPESIKTEPSLTTDAKVGDPATNFNITVTATGRAAAFDDAAVRKLLAGAVQRKVPAGQELTDNPIETSYKVASTSADGTVTLDGHAQAFTRPMFSAGDIRAKVKGQSPAKARSRLQQVPGVVDVAIRQRPLALPWLPRFSSRIFIRVQEASVNLTK